MEQSLISRERMRTFVRIAERGNLAVVSRETGAGQSTVTRHLRELEEALGVSLLTRTTRRTALTDEGTRYYAQCAQILSLVEQASQEMRDTRQATAGTVRISCTGDNVATTRFLLADPLNEHLKRRVTWTRREQSAES